MVYEIRGKRIWEKDIGMERWVQMKIVMGEEIKRDRE